MDTAPEKPNPHAAGEGTITVPEAGWTGPGSMHGTALCDCGNCADRRAREGK